LNWYIIGGMVNRAAVTFWNFRCIEVCVPYFCWCRFCISHIVASLFAPIMENTTRATFYLAFLISQQSLSLLPLAALTVVPTFPLTYTHLNESILGLPQFVLIITLQRTLIDSIWLIDLTPSLLHSFTHSLPPSRTPFPSTSMLLRTTFVLLLLLFLTYSRLVVSQHETLRLLTIGDSTDRWGRQTYIHDVVTGGVIPLLATALH
jgi:hypothetical protein